ncbi:MAG: RNA methyltransferase [Spirochaetaceae bacterium]|jgi:RsmE family RNA methyltransferase|nr:RNA methyltransferase [Spirochaetaceae bacterium]
MNLILFEPREVEAREGALYGELAPHDPRAVHLLKTLHKTKGGSFEAGIIGGNRGRGIIVSVAAPVAVTLALNDPPPPRLPVRLGVGFARPIQLRRILREAANMGLESAAFFGTDLGEKSYRQTTLLEDGGARAAMLEGAIEARDTRFPAVNRFESVDRWLAGREKPGRRIALDNVQPQGSFFKESGRSPPETGYTLAVGSERGWSDRERRLLEASGFTRLSIGERALRTETACIAALVLAMERCPAFFGVPFDPLSYQPENTPGF